MAEAARYVPAYTADTPVNTTTMSAMGWERYRVGVIESISEMKKEQIGALGWDGPLAAISHTRVNLSDYFKETVAVVTNPAIDREREVKRKIKQEIAGAG